MKGNSGDAHSINTYLDILKGKVYDYQKELVQEGKFITGETMRKKLLGTEIRSRMLILIFENHNFRRYPHGLQYIHFIVWYFKIRCHHIPIHSSHCRWHYGLFRNDEAMNLKPNFSFICLNTSLKPSWFNSPLGTSVSFALKPKVVLASSSLPIQNINKLAKPAHHLLYLNSIVSFY